MDWIEVDVLTHRSNDSIWVKCIAEIRHNTTGEVVEYETDEILINGEEYPMIFNWEENNFSCDCNRLLFFKRASIILLLVAANVSASCRRAVAHVRAVGRWLLCYQSEWEGNMSNQMGVAATRELYSTGRRRLPNHLESLFYTACIFEIKSGWDNWSRIMRESMPHESCA